MEALLNSPLILFALGALGSYLWGNQQRQQIQGVNVADLAARIRGLERGMEDTKDLSTAVASLTGEMKGFTASLSGVVSSLGSLERDLKDALNRISDLRVTTNGGRAVRRS